MRRLNVSTGAQLVNSQASLLPKVSFMAYLGTNTAGQSRSVATDGFAAGQQVAAWHASEGFGSDPGRLSYNSCMASCPNCSSSMGSMFLESTIGTKQQVNACAACSLLWFDHTTGTRLAPASVLAVFKTIAAGGERPQLRPELRCPDCRSALAFIHDLVRQTRFTYWRCPADHGQLIGYTQFLLEKNFIRPPSSEELARLRATVREITCSQCGAPIDLAKDSACPFCHTAVTLIDPDSIAKALRELSFPALNSPAQAPSTVPSAAVHEAQMKAIFDADRIARSEGRHDLLSIGAGAISGLLTGLI